MIEQHGRDQAQYQNAMLRQKYDSLRQEYIKVMLIFIGYNK